MRLSLVSLLATALLAACAGSSAGGGAWEPCGSAGTPDAGPDVLDEVEGTVSGDISLFTVADGAAFLLGDADGPSGVAVILSSRTGVCEAASRGALLGDATNFILLDVADSGALGCGALQVDPAGAGGSHRFAALEWLYEECESPEGGDSRSGSITLDALGPDWVSGYFLTQTSPLGQYTPPSLQLAGSFTAPVCPLDAATAQQLFTTGRLSGCD